MTVETETLIWNVVTKNFDEPASQPRSDRFLRLGAVPDAWLAKASQLPGKALAVGLSIWSLAIAVKKSTVMVTPDNLRQYEIDPPAKSRAITALAKAGLIAVERKRGRFPTVTLLVGGEVALVTSATAASRNV